MIFRRVTFKVENLTYCCHQNV